MNDRQSKHFYDTSEIAIENVLNTGKVRLFFSRRETSSESLDTQELENQLNSIFSKAVEEKKKIQTEQEEQLHIQNSSD